jgi:hypothetical protein
MSLSASIKSIQDIMRKDMGVARLTAAQTTATRLLDATLHQILAA